MVNKSSEFQLSFNMHFLVIFFYYFTMHSGFKKIESGLSRKLNVFDEIERRNYHWSNEDKGDKS